MTPDRWKEVPLTVGVVRGWPFLRQFLPEEVITRGQDRALVIGRIRGTGRSSGAPFESDWPALFTIAGGYVLSEHAFFDRAKALAALGLSE